MVGLFYGYYHMKESFAENNAVTVKVTIPLTPKFKMILGVKRRGKAVKELSDHCTSAEICLEVPHPGPSVSQSAFYLDPQVMLLHIRMEEALLLDISSSSDPLISSFSTQDWRTLSCK